MNTSLVRIERLALAAVLAVLVAAAAAQQVSSWLRLGHDGELTPSESESLLGLRLASTGQAVYHDFRHPPHVVTQYTPLFYYGPGWVARALGAGVLETFVIGRVWTHVFWLGVAGMIWALARQAGCGGFSAGLGAAFWLAGLLAPEWAQSYRPDAPAIFFSLAAWWMYRRGAHPARLVVVALLLAVAFLEKQSTVSALAVIMALERRRAIGLAAVWLTIVATVALALQRLSGGAFSMNVWGSVAQPGPWSQVLALLAGAGLRGAPVWLGASARRRPEEWPLVAYGGLALVVAVVSSVKPGAWLNYYLEPLAVGCVLTAVWLERGGHTYWRLAWLGLALGGAVQVLSDRMVAAHRLPVDAPGMLAGQVLAAGEPVLVEDMYVAIRGDRTPYLLHGAQFVTLRRRGQFDDSELVGRIAAGRFRTIALELPVTEEHHPRQFPSNWLQAMRQSYILAEIATNSTQHLWFYRPRQDHPS